jgi:multiple sugar transport system permease protein
MDIQDFYNPLVYLIPKHFTSYNLKTAFDQLNYVKVIGTTVLYSGVLMLVQAFICSLIGYGFARFKFPGSNILFGLVVLTIVLPSQLFMVPLYTQFKDFNPLGLGKLLGFGTKNLLNTPFPMLLMSITGMGLRSGLYIYIFRQFFRGLPKEIEEAAFIDGAGPYKTFFKVMLPNAIPSMVTVMLFSFVWQYNDTFYSNLFTSKLNLISIKITTLASQAAYVLQIKDPNQVGLILDAGILLVILPLIIIYLFLQKYFIEGVERSGIVG